MAFTRQHRRLVFGAHLVWDEGFGEGRGDELWEYDEDEARALMLEVVCRYRGRVAGWIRVNEAIGAHTDDGLRTDVPGR